MFLINFISKFPLKKFHFLYLFTLLIFLSNFRQTNYHFLQSIQSKTSFLENNYHSFAEKEDERSQGANQNCLLIKNNIVYDLFDLSNKAYYSEKNGSKITYQFCKNIESFNSPVILNDTETNTIIKLSGSVMGEPNNKNKILINNSTVTLLLSRGEKCKSNTNDFYKFQIILTCNNSIDFVSEELEVIDDCNFQINATTKYACENNNIFFISKIIDNEYRILIGVIICILGIILGILSYKFLNLAIYIVCMAAFPSLFYYLCDLLIPNNVENKYLYLYILVGAGIIIGGIVAFLLTMKKKFIKIYMCIIGGVLGFLISKFLYDVVISLIETQYQRILSYLITSICILIGIIFGIFFARVTCIIGTSTLGGYALMRGISFFLKGIVDYIDENKIFYYASKIGNYEQIAEEIKPLFYIYPGMWVVFIIIFTIIQHKINPKQDDCDDYKELESKFEKSKLFPEDNPDDERVTEN